LFSAAPSVARCRAGPSLAAAPAAPRPPPHRPRRALRRRKRLCDHPCPARNIRA